VELPLASKLVMPGLEPGIHVFDPTQEKDVDGRVKPGHDENEALMLSLSKSTIGSAFA